MEDFVAMLLIAFVLPLVIIALGAPLALVARLVIEIGQRIWS
jgi:hypothetical protein